MRKYIVTDLTESTAFTNQAHTKTEQELREWAEEIRQNEGLQDVIPNYTDKYDSLDGLRREGYIEDIDECIEFLEGYDWEIVEEIVMNLLDNAHKQITKDTLNNMKWGQSMKLNKRFTLYKYEESVFNETQECFVLEDNKYDTDTFSVQYDEDDEIVITDFYGYDDDEDFNN